MRLQNIYDIRHTVHIIQSAKSGVKVNEHEHFVFKWHQSAVGVNIENLTILYIYVK